MLQLWDLILHPTTPGSSGPIALLFNTRDVLPATCTKSRSMYTCAGVQAAARSAQRRVETRPGTWLCAQTVILTAEHLSNEARSGRSLFQTFKRHSSCWKPPPSLFDWKTNSNTHVMPSYFHTCGVGHVRYGAAMRRTG